MTANRFFFIMAPPFWGHVERCVMAVVNQFIILVFFACLALSGCVLDEPPKYGEPCSNIAYILENAEDSENQGNIEKCMRGECPRYSKFFDADYCPQTSPYCIIDESNGNYCISSCTKNHHFVMDPQTQEEESDEDKVQLEHYCEADTVEHCGSHDLDCSNDPDRNPGWESGYCNTQTETDYPCIATSCKPFYKVDKDPRNKLSDKCTRNDLCCGKVCANCTNNSSSEAIGTPKYGYILCSSEEDNAVCIESCPDGYKPCNGVCIDNSKTCES